MKDENHLILLIFPLGLSVFWLRERFYSLDFVSRILFGIFFLAAASLGLLLLIYLFSPWAKANRKRIETLKSTPLELLVASSSSVLMGVEADLFEKIFLPDHIRTRHVHILGATGSGKTESVILNFLRQDVSRGLGSIILDAKGDGSFLDEIQRHVPADRLRIFDLGSPDSLSYDPLEMGAPFESAQRLFSALTWSEEYYKSKALSALQRIFQIHFEMNRRNPTLIQLRDYLETPKSYSAFIASDDFPKSLALSEFQDLSGLRDQVRSLTIGHMAKTLSPPGGAGIQFKGACDGVVIYFRLQSLISPQLVSILGKLVINHLNFFVGTAHREKSPTNPRQLIPVYFDEFASFACPEFADLISKARSAGFALHFSHQSIGDLTEVSPGFLNRITDNAATKIVLRINDPDSAEFLARSFGTRLVQKTTQRITNTKDIESAEIVGEGTTRDAHQFRASPDLLKTLPTGMGAVLIAHGRDAPHGASSVFKIRFPALASGSSLI